MVNSDNRCRGTWAKLAALVALLAAPALANEHELHEHQVRTVEVVVTTYLEYGACANLCPVSFKTMHEKPSDPTHHHATTTCGCEHEHEHESHHSSHSCTKETHNKSTPVKTTPTGPHTHPDPTHPEHTHPDHTPPPHSSPSSEHPPPHSPPSSEHPPPPYHPPSSEHPPPPYHPPSGSHPPPPYSTPPGDYPSPGNPDKGKPHGSGAKNDPDDGETCYASGNSAYCIDANGHIVGASGHKIIGREMPASD